MKPQLEGRYARIKKAGECFFFLPESTALLQNFLFCGSSNLQFIEPLPFFAPSDRPKKILNYEGSKPYIGIFRILYHDLT